MLYLLSYLGGVLHEPVDADGDGEDEDQQGYEEARITRDDHVRPINEN